MLSSLFVGTKHKHDNWLVIVFQVGGKKRESSLNSKNKKLLPACRQFYQESQPWIPAILFNHLPGCRDRETNGPKGMFEQ